MQTRKKHSERKNEILDAAEILFLTNGYEKSTVKNIIDGVGIAKGTFYHYFKAKEDVLDSIISRVTEIVIERAEDIAKNPELSPIEKIIDIILSMNVQDKVDNEYMQMLHRPENALIHQKSLTLMVTKITPILERVVDEGIKQGVFISEFPRQYIQIFLTSSMTLLDEGIFEISSEEQQIIIKALTSLLDKMLGVVDGTFGEVVKQYYG